jgi:hypothetical protein
MLNIASLARWYDLVLLALEKVLVSVHEQHALGHQFSRTEQFVSEGPHGALVEGEGRAVQELTCCV